MIINYSEVFRPPTCGRNPPFQSFKNSKNQDHSHTVRVSGLSCMYNVNHIHIDKYCKHIVSVLEMRISYCIHHWFIYLSIQEVCICRPTGLLCTPPSAFGNYQQIFIEHKWDLNYFRLRQNKEKGLKKFDLNMFILELPHWFRELGVAPSPAAGVSPPPVPSPPEEPGLEFMERLLFLPPIPPPHPQASVVG